MPATKGGELARIRTRSPNLPTLKTKADICSCPSYPNESLRVSKAWTEFEKELPVFHREALARLLCLEHFRNLIETQALDAGTTVYTDHAPSTYVGSLSNKGGLSTWRIHETSDLTGRYKAGQYLGPGPYGGMADPRSLSHTSR
jgi:hypothetical protein